MSNAGLNSLRCCCLGCVKAQHATRAIHEVQYGSKYIKGAGAASWQFAGAKPLE